MIEKIEKSEWIPFLERASEVLAGKQAEIEAASLKLGDQVEIEWLPLLGLAYDPKNDLIEVDLDQFEHLIHHPQELYIEVGEPDQMISLEVRDADGVQHIIKLRDPLLLPAPGEQSPTATTSH
jgi:hypothetical protein